MTADWGKAGAVCTDDQATELVNRLFVQWPDQAGKYEKLGILEKAIEEWTKRLKEWPYTYADRAIEDWIEGQGFWPKWFDIRDAMNTMALRARGGTPD